MKKRRFHSGQIANNPVWFEQRNLDYLNYCSVYQKLDDLTNKGFTAMQIEEMLNLGEKKFNKNKNGK